MPPSSAPTPSGTGPLPGGEDEPDTEEESPPLPARLPKAIPLSEYRTPDSFSIEAFTDTPSLPRNLPN
jgi:hypothetical protein